MFGFAATPTHTRFTMAIALYLFGMGLINPLGTAIALHPFGQQAGFASALLGFLQMGCAAIGASLQAFCHFRRLCLLLCPDDGFGACPSGFLPVALRRPKRRWRLRAGTRRRKGIVSLRMSRKGAHYEPRHSHRYEGDKASAARTRRPLSRAGSQKPPVRLRPLPAAWLLRAHPGRRAGISVPQSGHCRRRWKGLPRGASERSNARWIFPWPAVPAHGSRRRGRG